MTKKYNFKINVSNINFNHNKYNYPKTESLCYIFDTYNALPSKFIQTRSDSIVIISFREISNLSILIDSIQKCEHIYDDLGNDLIRLPF